MSQVSIEGKEHFIKEIFSDSFEFFMPLYQRPYSWDTERAEALLNDLWTAALEDEKTDIQNLEPYFLGCIVLIKDKDKSKSEIVDGQQRITTLTILLSALRASLPDEKANLIETFLYQKGNAIAGTENRYRLTLRDKDEQFFQNNIQNPEGIQKISFLNITDLNDSQKLIRENALLFLQRLQEPTNSETEYLFNSITNISDDQKFRLAQFIIQRCLLVVVSTPTLETAYRIFSILNDRGFNISLTDILKADLIGKITKEQQQKKYTNKWEEIEEKLTRKDFAELFSHIRTISRKAKASKNILEELHEYVITKQMTSANAKDFIDKTLEPYANAFMRIKKSESNKELKDLFSWLNEINNFDWLPPAIYFLSHSNKTEESCLDFFYKLERLAACLMIIKADTNQRIARYNQLLNAIERGNISGIDTVLQLSSKEQEKLIKNLDGDVYLMQNIRRYILLRLDRMLSTGGASYDYKITTVEHILPQNPPQNSEWSQLFPTAVREKYLHRLGNLVLLTTEKNTKAQNYSFSEKKEIYFRAKDGISPFAITSQVLKEEEWTPSVIEKRQAELLDVVKRTWKLQESNPVVQGTLFE